MKRLKITTPVRLEISGRINKVQRKAADYLNSRTRDFSKNAWLFLLVLFCIAFGSSCLYLLIHAIL